VCSLLLCVEQLSGLWVVFLPIVVWFSVATFGWRYVVVHCYLWEIDTILDSGCASGRVLGGIKLSSYSL
jgi:hypothetical protein